MDKSEIDYVRQITLQSIVIEQLIKCVSDGAVIQSYPLVEIIDKFFQKYENHQVQDLIWKAKKDFDSMILQKLFMAQEDEEIAS